MNSLSWFLYFADVIPNIAKIFYGIGFSSIAVFVLWVLYWKPFLIVSVFSFLVSAFIPNTETIYMIAGSELGETAITSERGQRVADKIEAYIDLQLDSAKTPTK